MHPLSSKLIELSFAVPQVMAYRLFRVAMAGGTPTRRDRAELARTSMEKVEAFVECWTAMSLAAMRAQQAWVLSCWAMQGRPTHAAAASVMVRSNEALLNIIGSGLKPIHRRAIANAKRLAR